MAESFSCTCICDGKLYQQSSKGTSFRPEQSEGHLSTSTDLVLHAGAEVANAVHELGCYAPPDCIHVGMPGEDGAVGCMVCATWEVLYREHPPSARHLDNLQSLSANLLLSCCFQC